MAKRASGERTQGSNQKPDQERLEELRNDPRALRLRELSGPPKSVLELEESIAQDTEFGREFALARLEQIPASGLTDAGYCFHVLSCSPQSANRKEDLFNHPHAWRVSHEWLVREGRDLGWGVVIRHTRGADYAAEVQRAHRKALAGKKPPTPAQRTSKGSPLQEIEAKLNDVLRLLTGMTKLLLLMSDWVGLKPDTHKSLNTEDEGAEPQDAEEQPAAETGSVGTGGADVAGSARKRGRRPNYVWSDAEHEEFAILRCLKPRLSTEQIMQQWAARFGREMSENEFAWAKTKGGSLKDWRERLIRVDKLTPDGLRRKTDWDGSE